MAGDGVGYNVNNAITVKQLDFIFMVHCLLPFTSYLDLPSAGDMKRMKDPVVDTKTRCKSCFYFGQENAREECFFLVLWMQMKALQQREYTNSQKYRTLVSKRRIRCKFRAHSTFSSFIELLA